MAEGQLFGLPIGKGSSHFTVPRGQGITESPCIGAGLGLAGGDVGTETDGGVADETDPTESHPRALQIENRLDQRLFTSHDHLEQGRRQGSAGRGSHLGQMFLPNQTRWHRPCPLNAVTVSHQILKWSTCGVVAVPDKVDDSVW